MLLTLIYFRKLNLMKRIMIIGSGGAGKSTLARELAVYTGIDIYHLDTFYWQHGWKRMEKEEWIRVVSGLSEKEKWIIDGNYRSTMETRFEKADTIIFLDYNRLICLYRVIKRFLKYRNKTRPDMNKDCPEMIDLEFLIWIWKFPGSSKKNILRLIKKYKDSGKKIIILRNPRQTRRFIKELSTNI